MRPVSHNATSKEKRGRRCIVSINRDLYYRSLEKDPVDKKSMDIFRRPPYGKLGGEKHE